MARFYVSLFFLIPLTLSLSGCLPVEDTTPSSALFPASSQYGAEVRRDFSGQLSKNASRRDVELHALFGSFYAERSSQELRPVLDSLNKGFYQDDNGKRIYRVESVNQAQQILAKSWKYEKWSPNSALAKRFASASNASIAILGNSDQRILFFDQSDQLIGVYPKAS